MEKYEFVTLKKASEELGLKEEEILQKIEQGLIRSIERNETHLIPVSEISRLILDDIERAI